MSRIHRARLLGGFVLGACSVREPLPSAQPLSTASATASSAPSATPTSPDLEVAASAPEAAAVAPASCVSKLTPFRWGDPRSKIRTLLPKLGKSVDPHEDTTDTTFGGVPARLALQFPPRNNNGLGFVGLFFECGGDRERCAQVFSVWAAAWQGLQARPPDESPLGEPWKHWTELDGGQSSVLMLKDDVGRPATVALFCSPQ
jgi:hypothetical protein